MKIDGQLLELENDSKNAEVVKELLIGQLVKDGYLTDEESIDIVNTYQVLVYKPTWFPSLMKRLGITDTNKWRYRIVKFDKKI